MAKKNSSEEKEKTSLAMAKTHMRALRYISFADERTQADIINEAIADFISKWEKKNGPVPPQK